MTYKLLLQWIENNQQKNYEISSQNSTKIGRDNTPGQCDLIINPNDLKISRVHIEIFFDQKKNIFLLQNLANQNPHIKINGTAFTHGQIPLTKDTAITLGSTMIKVVDIVPIVPPTVINFSQKNNQVTIKYYENNIEKKSISAQSIALGRHLPTIQQRVQNNNIIPLEINHDRISSYHALIEVENEQLFITDQKSSNGTLINEKPQIPYIKAILRNGDHLKLGKMDVEGQIIITQNEMMIEIHNIQNQLSIQPPPAPKPQIKINLYDGNGNKQNHILTPPIAIGRELNIVKQKVQNNITPIEINHSSISGYHAIIDVENGQFILTDQNSSNGSFVNNIKQNAQTNAKLKNGDKLTLGIIESEITLKNNEMIINVNNHPECEPGLKCPNRKCEKTIINKTKNDFCPYCGTFLGTALSLYIPKKH